MFLFDDNFVYTVRRRVYVSVRECTCVYACVRECMYVYGCA